MNDPVGPMKAPFVSVQQPLLHHVSEGASRTEDESTFIKLIVPRVQDWYSRMPIRDEIGNVVFIVDVVRLERFCIHTTNRTLDKVYHQAVIRYPNGRLAAFLTNKYDTGCFNPLQFVLYASDPSFPGQSIADFTELGRMYIPDSTELSLGPLYFQGKFVATHWWKDSSYSYFRYCGPDLDRQPWKELLNCTWHKNRCPQIGRSFGESGCNRVDYYEASYSDRKEIILRRNIQEETLALSTDQNSHNLRLVSLFACFATDHILLMK